MSAIRTENLVKRYGWFLARKKLAVDHLDMEVEEGELFGFLGPNGAGKTTTIKLLLGLIRPTTGQATVFGVSAQDRSIKSRIGFLPDSPNFYSHLSGLDFLLFCGKLHHQARLQRNDLARALLEKVGLAEAAKQTIGGYSRGMKQRLGIAQALIHNPDLIILDEPMNGLDPLGRREVKQLMLQLKADGKTVFFSSHILPDVEEMCDRVAILNRGKLLRIGSVPEMLAEPYDAVIATGLPAVAEVQATNKGWRMRREGERWIFAIEPEQHANQSDIEAFIAESNGQVHSVEKLSDTLEDAFLRLVAADEKHRREERNKNP